MIEITIQTGFVLYVLIMLGLLVVAALYETLRQNTQSWTLSREELGYCDHCLSTFIAPRSETSAACPRCGKRVIVGKHTSSS